MERKYNTQTKLKIRKGDNVKVIAGDSKGQSGKVLSVSLAKNTVIVEGINMVSKHTKPNAKNTEGGIVKMEAPVNVSNVMLIDLLQKRQASEYLCGNGAASYQEDDLFNKENINVKYNTFNHPNYEQFSTDGFIKGLSIVDALMNVGFNKVEKLIKN